MTIKTCRHCDIRFNRDDAAPIPHDRCERCHEEIEAMKRSAACACGDIYPANSYGAGFMEGNNGVCENCDMADEHSLDRLEAALVRASAKWERGDMEARSKYHHEIKPGVWVDVYDVLAAWSVDNPALQHLIKKALQPGERGHKTREQDLDDIIASAKRAKELEQ